MSDAHSTSGRQTMAERYGTPPAHRRTALIATCTCIVVLGCGWLAWAAWGQNSDQVRGELASFDVRSDHEVAVSIDLRRSQGDPVVCTVIAKAADFAIVGADDVTIPGGDDAVTFDATVRTDRRATSATVEDCRPAP